MLSFDEYLALFDEGPVAGARDASRYLRDCFLHYGSRTVELIVGPLTNPKDADNLVDLFKEITDLGTIEPLDGGISADGMRRFKVLTSSSDNELLDLFTFHVSREQVSFVAMGQAAPTASAQADEKDQGFGFFEPIEPAAPVATAAALPCGDSITSISK